MKGTKKKEGPERNKALSGPLPRWGRTLGKNWKKEDHAPSTNWLRGRIGRRDRRPIQLT